MINAKLNQHRLVLPRDQVHRGDSKDNPQPISEFHVSFPLLLNTLKIFGVSLELSVSMAGPEPEPLLTYLALITDWRVVRIVFKVYCLITIKGSPLVPYSVTYPFLLPLFGPRTPREEGNGLKLCTVKNLSHQTDFIRKH